MWAADVVAQLRAGLEPLADPARARGSRAYMKDVAPFLGIPAPALRTAEKSIWRRLPCPDESQLIAATDALWQLPEREYQYAATDLLGRFLDALGPETLDRDVRRYVATKPWWDTVDLLNSRSINPLVRRYPDLVDVMWAWNRSTDQWLIRASIQHQRGSREHTDVRRLVAMCAPHAADRRFFVAKAVGWALRDLTGIDPAAVEQFLADHPALPVVARREAAKGLARARS